MKKEMVIVVLILIFLVSLSSAAEARFYIGGMYARQLEHDAPGTSWLGITLRSLGNGLFGSDLDFRFHSGDYMGEDYFILRINPFLHLNLKLGQLNLYGGISPFTVQYLSYGEGEWEFDFHLFYAKAGAQYDFGPLGVFAHGLNRLELDDIEGSLRQMGLEFGAAFGF